MPSGLRYAAQRMGTLWNDSGDGSKLHSCEGQGW